MMQGVNQVSHVGRIVHLSDASMIEAINGVEVLDCIADCMSGLDCKIVGTRDVCCAGPDRDWNLIDRGDVDQFCLGLTLQVVW